MDMLKPKTIQSIRESLLNDNRDVMVIAHRGNWRQAPENSLESILAAIEAGVDIVEVDVRLTKDSIPILMHDRTLDRTTNGSGLVSEWSLAELKSLSLKNGTGRITQFKIPTLEEALMVAKGKAMINLDKSYDIFSQIYRIIQKTGTENHIIMKGQKPYAEVSKDLAPYLDDIYYMPVIRMGRVVNPIQMMKEFEQGYNPKAYEVIFDHEDRETLEFIQLIRSHGDRVWVNSLWPNLCAGHDDDKALLNPDGTWGWLLDHDIDMIQTDRPRKLIHYLKSRTLLSQ